MPQAKHPLIILILSILYNPFSIAQTSNNGNQFSKEILSCKEYTTSCLELNNIDFPNRIVLNNQTTNKITITSSQYIDYSCRDSLHQGYYLRNYIIHKPFGKQQICTNHKTLINKYIIDTIIWPLDTVILEYNSDQLNTNGISDLHEELYAELTPYGFYVPKIVLDSSYSIGLIDPPFFIYNGSKLPLLGNNFHCNLYSNFTDSITLNAYNKYTIDRYWVISDCDSSERNYHQTIIIEDKSAINIESRYGYASSDTLFSYNFDRSINLNSYPWLISNRINKNKIVIYKDSLNGGIISQMPWKPSQSNIELPIGEFFIVYYINSNDTELIIHIENLVIDRFSNRLLNVLNCNTDTFSLDHLIEDTSNLSFLKIYFSVSKELNHSPTHIHGHITRTHLSGNVYKCPLIKMSNMAFYIQHLINITPNEFQFKCSDLKNHFLFNQTLDTFLYDAKNYLIPLPVSKNGNTKTLSPGPFLDDSIIYVNGNYIDFINTVFSYRDSLISSCNGDYLIIRKWSNFSWRFGLPWEFQQTIIVNNILPTKNEFNLPDTILYLPEHKINLRDLFQSCEFHDFKLKSVTIQTNDSIFVQNEKVKFEEDIIYFTLDTGEYQINIIIDNFCNTIYQITQHVQVNSCLYRYPADFTLHCSLYDFYHGDTSLLLDSNFIYWDTFGNPIPLPIGKNGIINKYVPSPLSDLNNDSFSLKELNIIAFENSCTSEISFSDSLNICIKQSSILREWTYYLDNGTSFKYNQTISLINDNPIVNYELGDTTIKSTEYVIDVSKTLSSCFISEVDIDAIYLDSLPIINTKASINKNILLLFLSPGTYNLLIEIKDHCGDLITITQKIMVNSNISNSLFNRSNGDVSIKVFPNPSSNNFNIEFYSGTYQIVDLKIFNIQNQLIYKHKQMATTGLNTIDINRINEKGVYIFTLNINDEVLKGKLLRL